MSDSRGWIMLHRNIIDNEIWSKDPFSRGHAWIDLLLNANHKPKKLMLKGTIIEIERGQQVRSILTLSTTWRWSRSKVTRYLKLLKNEHMIDYKTGHLTTLITVCNYERYQNLSTGGDTSDEHLTNIRRTSDEHLTNINKNVKNEKNDKNEKNLKEINKEKNTPSSALPPVDFSNLNMTDFEIQEFKRIRKKNKGGALTQRVVNAIAKEFKQGVKQGFSIDSQLTEWEVRGWKGFKADWMPRMSSNVFDLSNQIYGEGKI